MWRERMTKAKDRATRRILGDTEAFDTMINYIYNPLGGERFNLNHLGCPQKLFELMTVAQKYQILNLTTMTSDALESLTVIRENVIFTATVAKNYKTAFDDVSTKLLVKLDSIAVSVFVVILVEFDKYRI